MELITEIQADSQKILIVDKKTGHATALLKTTLSNLGADVYFSSRIPQDVRKFDLLFFINFEAAKIPFHKITSRLNLLVIENPGPIKKLHALITKKALHNVKLIHLGRDAGPEEIDKVLWFSLSKGPGRYLDLTSATAPAAKKRYFNERIIQAPSPRTFIIFFLFAILIIHLLLLPLQFAAFYLIMPPQKPFAQTALVASRLVYRATRTSYSFFSSALLPDRMNDINTRLVRIPDTISKIKNTTALVRLLGEKKEPLPQDLKILNESLNSLARDLHILETDVTAIVDKFPDFPSTMTHYEKEFAEARSRARTARILTRAAREHLTLSDAIPQGLLIKLIQVISSL